MRPVAALATVAIALSLALPATEAGALSCRRPDVARAFRQASEAPDPTIVVLGKLSYDTGLLPRGVGMGNDSARHGLRLTARLRGRSLSGSGFGPRISENIALDIRCVSAWCGRIPPNEEVLMFLRKTDSGHVLEVGPCPQFFFVTPSEAQIATARQCLSGGPCTPGLR